MVFRSDFCTGCLVEGVVQRNQDDRTVGIGRKVVEDARDITYGQHLVEIACRTDRVGLKIPEQQIGILSLFQKSSIPRVPAVAGERIVTRVGYALNGIREVMGSDKYSVETVYKHFPARTVPDKDALAFRIYRYVR